MNMPRGHKKALKATNKQKNISNVIQVNGAVASFRKEKSNSQFFSLFIHHCAVTLKYNFWWFTRLTVKFSALGLKNGFEVIKFLWTSPHVWPCLGFKIIPPYSTESALLVFYAAMVEWMDECLFFFKYVCFEFGAAAA